MKAFHARDNVLSPKDGVDWAGQGQRRYTHEEGLCLELRLDNVSGRRPAYHFARMRPVSAFSSTSSMTSSRSMRDLFCLRHDTVSSTKLGGFSLCSEASHRMAGGRIPQDGERSSPVEIGTDHVFQLNQCDNLGRLQYFFDSCGPDSGIVTLGSPLAWLIRLCDSSPILARTMHLVCRHTLRKERIVVFVDTPWLQQYVSFSLPSLEPHEAACIG